MQRVGAARPGQRARRRSTCGAPTGIGYNVGQDQEDRSANAPVDSWNADLRSRRSSPSSRTAASPCSTRPTRSSRPCSRISASDPNSQTDEDLKRGRSQADGDPAVHPQDPLLAVHRRSRQRRDLRRGRLQRRHPAGARPRRGSRSRASTIKYCDPEGRRDHLVRHAGDPGGRAAPGQRARLHQLHDGARGRRRRTRNFVNYANGNKASLAVGRRRTCKNDPEHLSAAGGDGEAVPGRWRTRRVHAPAEPDLDAVHRRASRTERHETGARHSRRRRAELHGRMASQRGTQHAETRPRLERSAGQALTCASSNVTKKFGDFVAVDDVSLDIYKGEMFCLLGGSGCGKTTLLRMLAGFEKPTSGTHLHRRRRT